MRLRSTALSRGAVLSGCGVLGGPAVGGAVAVGEVVGGVDEGDVGEGLRQVADQAPGMRVVFLGKQADVVA